MVHKNAALRALGFVTSLVVVAVGCRATPSTPPTPTTPILTTSVPTPIPTPIIASIPTRSSQAALDACDLALQGQAMRPSLEPDWQSQGIDTCYNLTFDFTASGPDYTGTAEITYTNPGTVPLPDVVLRLYPNASEIYGGSLVITSAKVGDSTLETTDFLRDGSAVHLPLPQVLDPGNTLTLHLEFTGSLPIDFGLGQTYGIFNYTSQGPVLVMANAYPMLAPLEYGSWRADPVQGAGDAVVSRTALYRVSVQAPDNWQIASSGSKVDDNLEAGVRTTQYATGPMREFMLVASPLLVLQEENVQDIRIQHWGLPETTPGWKDTLNVGVNSLDLYNTSFGPYPYREFDIISAPLRNAAGVEYPGLILIGDFLYTNTDTPSRLPTVVAHEVAHQWWYGLVGSDVLLHPWQDEALATFSAQLYEQKYDPAYYNGANDYYQDAVKQLEDKQGPQKIDGSVSSFAQSGAYGVVVYLKGELFFEAVRDKIGDQKFFAGLQEYFQHSQYRTAAPDDLLGSFEGACSCSLDELYTEWGVQ